VYEVPTTSVDPSNMPVSHVLACLDASAGASLGWADLYSAVLFKNIY
jgi:hypothetical protein